MVKSILSPMGVSCAAEVNIGNVKMTVKSCTKIVFTYHPKKQRTTFRVGEMIINSTKKVDELLDHAGYSSHTELYKDFGADISFFMNEGKLILYLLEFTDQKFNFR